jgi:hypothetical protein
LLSLLWKAELLLTAVGHIGLVIKATSPRELLGPLVNINEVGRVKSVISFANTPPVVSVYIHTNAGGGQPPAPSYISSNDR